METITTSEDALLAGLIGRGIMLSRTPLMHMREAQAQGGGGLAGILNNPQLMHLM